MVRTPEIKTGAKPPAPRYGTNNGTVTVQETTAELETMFKRWAEASGSKFKWRLVRDRKDRNNEEGPALLVVTRDGREAELRCNSQRTYAQNVRSIYLYMDRLRMADAQGILRGLVEMGEMLLLPAGGETAHPDGSPDDADPWEVLGVRPGAGMDVVNAAYRAMVGRLTTMQADPDYGAKLKRLNLARDAIADLAKYNG